MKKRKPFVVLPPKGQSEDRAVPQPQHPDSQEVRDERDLTANFKAFVDGTKATKVVWEMMTKAGFRGRLGKNAQGTPEALHVNKRPERAGLGLVSEKTKQDLRFEFRKRVANGDISFTSSSFDPSVLPDGAENPCTGARQEAWSVASALNAATPGTAGATGVPARPLDACFVVSASVPSAESWQPAPKRRRACGSRGGGKPDARTPTYTYSAPQCTDTADSDLGARYFACGASDPGALTEDGVVQVRHLPSPASAPSVAVVVALRVYPLGPGSALCNASGIKQHTTARKLRRMAAGVKQRRAACGWGCGSGEQHVASSPLRHLRQRLEAEGASKRTPSSRRPQGTGKVVLCLWSPREERNRPVNVAKTAQPQAKFRPVTRSCFRPVKG